MERLRLPQLSRWRPFSRGFSQTTKHEPRQFPRTRARVTAHRLLLARAPALPLPQNRLTRDPAIPRSLLAAPCAPLPLIALRFVPTTSGCILHSRARSAPAIGTILAGASTSAFVTIPGRSLLLSARALPACRRRSRPAPQRRRLALHSLLISLKQARRACREYCSGAHVLFAFDLGY